MNLMLLARATVGVSIGPFEGLALLLRALIAGDLAGEIGSGSECGGELDRAEV